MIRAATGQLANVLLVLVVFAGVHVGYNTHLVGKYSNHGHGLEQFYRGANYSSFSSLTLKGSTGNDGFSIPLITPESKPSEVGHGRVHSMRQNLFLHGSPVGVSYLLCPKEVQNDSPSYAGRVGCPLLNPRASMDRFGSVNSPMPVKIRAWMSKSLQTHSYVLYFSSHIDVPKVTENVSLLVATEAITGPWMQSVGTQLKFSDIPCKSFHSPSVAVDDRVEVLHMFVHGHKCKNVKGSQPTLAFSSRDALNWKFAAQLDDTLKNVFYLTPPTAQHPDGFYYSVAKTQESRTGSGVLCRSLHLEGPFEVGPVVSQGMRHADVQLVKNRYLFIFFTLIGDEPERILLGTIDTFQGALNWMDWRLLPGPTIFEPTATSGGPDGLDVRIRTERSDAILPSRPGPSSGDDGGTRDPRFISSLSSGTKSFGDILSGYLFFAAHGETIISVAFIRINVLAYVDATRHRGRENIAPVIKLASSLSSLHGLARNSTRETSLITGTGRSGTMYTCRLFQAAGLNLSHDNEYDCGRSYPASDGAVSWYDAFNSGLEYDTVVHIVRDPLHTINSRIAKLLARPVVHAEFLRRQTGKFEETSDLEKVIRTMDTTAMVRFSLKHWVRRNSFVLYHAEWREKIEDISKHPIAAWRLCMAMHFGAKCPSLENWSVAISSVDSSINTGRIAPKGMANTTAADWHQRTWSWQDISRLGPTEKRYVLIAMQMARDFGYESYALNSSAIQLQDHTEAPVNYECRFDKAHKWDCFLPS